MTQRYAHLTNGSLRKATSIMDRVFEMNRGNSHRMEEGINDNHLQDRSL